MGILAFVGWLVGGVSMMVTAIISVATVVLLAPHVSPLLVLRQHKAQRLSEIESSSLYDILNELTERAGLSYRPTLYYLPTAMMTAFTVGLNKHSSIVVSDGLLRRMNRREISAILAHEVSHIKHQDMRIMAIADAMDQLVRMLSVLGLFWLLFSVPLAIFYGYAVPWLGLILLVILPSVTSMMKMKLSRTREFEADRMAGVLTQDPLALISALSRMEYREWRWLTRFFLLPKQPAELSPLRTHPETDERIARLELQAQEMASQHPSILKRGMDRMMSRHVWELNRRNFL